MASCLPVAHEIEGIFLNPKTSKSHLESPRSSGRPQNSRSNPNNLTTSATPVFRDLLRPGLLQPRGRDHIGFVIGPGLRPSPGHRPPRREMCDPTGGEAGGEHGRREGAHYLDLFSVTELEIPVAGWSLT